MGLIGKIIIALVLLFLLLKGMDYAAAQGILPAFVEPVRNFLTIMFSPVVAFVNYVLAYFFP
ncbi:hypothetical protein A2841_00445 [Candidatus Kaiserbacteria bacterium RIFCSPHIGHO2_01_FULL_48_10]|uniref:Uncharacterized protein n=1 Tax=Candidatus Kaiserbacteria bacterium RIFCSPHIGHO2_01_FULL_48_10 TaxID=1798476 RepID=A0A1F6C5P6_9BACT|nr:MAG: hypothetical protein A2841_00445 [Candidatus Kaiserbacteria bacterium RIFCSPHIGHO2_01_FULL_48_10]